MSSSDSDSSGGYGGGYSGGYSNHNYASSSSSSSEDYRPPARAGPSYSYQYTPTRQYSPPAQRYTPPQRYAPVQRNAPTRQEAPSASSEDEEDGGDSDGEETSDKHQHGEPTPAKDQDASNQKYLNFGAKTGNSGSSQNYTSGSHSSDGFGNEHPMEEVTGGHQSQNDHPSKANSPENEDHSTSHSDSEGKLGPEETPVPSNEEPNSPLPPLLMPRPGAGSNQEDMPHFEDIPSDSPPEISVPERGHDDDDSRSDHSSEDPETPEGEWIGLDPTLGHEAQRRWAEPNARHRKRKHGKKALLVSRWGVHLRRTVPLTSRAIVTAEQKMSGVGATGQSVSASASMASRLLEAAHATMARPRGFRLPGQRQSPEISDPKTLLDSLAERKLLTDGAALAARAEQETTLQPVYAFERQQPTPHSPTATPVYEALLGDTCFRILHLLPSTDSSSPIICRLTIEDLTDPSIQYEAVSYNWGTRHPRHNITFNGNSQEIGPSLHSLLLRLRLPTEPRSLWADAICIDQSNDTEKGHQVRLMQRIYLTAARVVVWLGEDIPGTGHSAMAATACKAVCRLAGTWSHAMHPGEMPRPVYKVGNRQYRLSTREMRDVAPSEQPEWAALRALFRREYWERLWVVQEVTSSTVAVVRWCDVEIPWTWVGIAACLIRHSHEKSTRMIDEADLRGVHNACLMFLLPDEEWASTPFLHLMRVLLRFKVTNQHDRAYAILGLPGLHTGDTSAPGKLFVQPDYSLSLLELYVTLAERIVNTHDNPLDLLSAVKHGYYVDCRLPTWIPRWDVTFSRSINGSHRAGMRFHAGGTSPPQIHPSCHRRATDGRLLLTARGRIIGTIATAEAMLTSPLPDGPGLASGWSPAVQRLYEWQQIGPSEVDTNESAMRAIAMTITAGQDWYGRLIDTVEAERQHLADFGAFASSTWNRPWSRAPKKTKLEPCGDRFALAVRNVSRQRGIFQAADGTLGIGPTAIISGDVICVLQGGSVPYVIRGAASSGNDSGCYWFVGECYMDGYMFGEALNSGRLVGEDAEWQMITLL